MLEENLWGNTVFSSVHYLLYKKLTAYDFIICIIGLDKSAEIHSNELDDKISTNFVSTSSYLSEVTEIHISASPKLTYLLIASCVFTKRKTRSKLF